MSMIHFLCCNPGFGLIIRRNGNSILPAWNRVCKRLSQRHAFARLLDKLPENIQSISLLPHQHSLWWQGMPLPLSLCCSSAKLNTALSPWIPLQTASFAPTRFSFPFLPPITHGNLVHLRIKKAQGKRQMGTVLKGVVCVAAQPGFKSQHHHRWMFTKKHPCWLVNLPMA